MSAPVRALLMLLAALTGCVAVTDAVPYRLLADDDDATGDDDDATGDDDDSGGDDDDATPCDTSWLVESASPVSLSFQLEPLLIQRCDPCHTVQDRGDLVFAATAVHDAVVGVPNLLGYGADMPRVTAGDPEASYLLHKLVGCGPADPTWGYFQSAMPPPIGETTPLTQEEVSLLYSWILQGAEDN